MVDVEGVGASSGVVIAVVVVDDDDDDVSMVVVQAVVPVLVSVLASITLMVLSSRRMLITGTSSGVFTNFSSSEGGSPRLTMRWALLTRTSLSLVCERRYMISSAAVTVSQTACIRFSTLSFHDGCCDRRTFQWCEELDSLSR